MGRDVVVLVWVVGCVEGLIHLAGIAGCGEWKSGPTVHPGRKMKTET